MTNPSRSRSNGRLARSGSSLRVDIAPMLQNPAIPSGVIAASEPPATMTSASPYWIALSALPIACAADAQADAVTQFGPLRPNFIEIVRAHRVHHQLRDEERLDAARAALEEHDVLRLDLEESADAGAADAAARASASSFAKSIPESFDRLVRRDHREVDEAVEPADLLSDRGAAWRRSALSSPAIRVVKSFASKLVIGPIPFWPSSIAVEG